MTDLRGILEELSLRQSDREDLKDLAIATVVAVSGPSPRPLGARMTVTRSGRMRGAVSAGCVESDVIRRALAVMESGKAELVRFSHDDDELGVGLACGGTIEVLIERADSSASVWRTLAELQSESTPAVLAQVIDPPSLRGVKLLASAAEIALAGDAEDSLPPILSDWMEAEAAGILERRDTRARTLTTPDGGARVSVEVLLPKARLFIVGATEIGRALTMLAKALDMLVTVIDPRRTFADTERFAAADRLIADWPGAALDAAGLRPEDAVVTLAHDRKIDLPALASALRSHAKYVGALGSRRTHEKRLATLLEQGFSPDDVGRIHGPVGLDIGAVSAEEIALAIVAEIVAVRHGRDTRRKRFVSGVVLAAGGSSRMGRPKQLLPLRGKLLLQHVLDAALASCLDEIVVVLGADAERVHGALALPAGSRLRVVVNPRYEEGLSESIRCGLAATSSRATTAAILLGDQPGIDAAFIDQMIRAHEVAGKDATRPVFGGTGEQRVPGHPVLFEKALWPELRALRGDEGARRVLREHAERIHEMRSIAPGFEDIDTPDDYARAAVD